MKLSDKGFTPLQIQGNINNNSRLPKGNLSITGFTLTELMIAMGILLIAISGLLTTFVYCILLNESNNNLVTAANDAQYVLEEIKGLAYNNINSYTPPAFNNLENETIPNPTVVEISGIKEVTVNVSWSERGRSRNWTLSTRIAR